MRKPAPRLAACIAALGALVSSACGGGGSDLPFGTPTPATAVASLTPTREPSPTPTVSLASLEDARTALRAGNYVEAAVLFDAIANTATDGQLQAEAWMGASIARYQHGDLAGAIVDLEAAFTAAVGTPSERRVGYLYGLRLVESGDGARAAGILGAVSEGPEDVLTPYVGAALANALVLSGDVDGGNAAWDAALADRFVNDTVKLAIYRDRADLALAQGAPALAADWLRFSTDLRATPEHRYELAGLAYSFGDTDTFSVQLRAIMAEAPNSRFAEQAIEDLTAAGYVVDAGQAGYVHYRRRNYAAARAWLGEAVAEPGLTAGDLAFRTYYLAASYDDDGYYAEAVPIYDSIEGIAPGSPYVHRAKYWAARAMEAQELSSAASERYVALVMGPPGEFSDESRFRAGYALLSTDPAAAIANWDLLNATRDGRLLYWRGRALEALESPQAEQAFRDAASADPISFYGQAAAIRLGSAEPPDAGFAPFDDPGPIDWAAIAAWVQPGAGAVPAAESAARDLADVGLTALAGELLEQEAEGHGMRSLEFLAYLRTASEAGLTDLAARWATGLAADAGSVPDDLARLAYPVDYVELMTEAGRVQKVDPLFLASLIRQESFWDPNALSIANAYGLTQVIPATGESIASALGYADWQVWDLWRPAVSIEFGAYYIGAQLRTFGSPYVALAAYNGGPGHAGVWASIADSDDPADFVEAVAFTETQGYVIRVMENYARYRALYR
ncbi:MAG: lytic transglycosylase domain-containing protein [Dehalococcoidia bacterium]